jgi:hypothetical protein
MAFGGSGMGLTAKSATVTAFIAAYCTDAGVLCESCGGAGLAMALCAG